MIGEWYQPEPVPMSCGQWPKGQLPDSPNRVLLCEVAPGLGPVTCHVHREAALVRGGFESDQCSPHAAMLPSEAI